MDVFKCIEFPDREFNSQLDMFKHLKLHEDKLISLKKKEIYEGHKKNQPTITNLDISMVGSAFKAKFDVDQDFIYPVISTTKFRDSHKDVHFDPCFNRTVKNQQGSVLYALDHKVEFANILAWEKHVEMFLSKLEWGLVGKEYEGETNAMIFKIAKKHFQNAKVLEAIEKMLSQFQNSIRMNYNKVILAINSKEKDLALNKQYFDARIDEIVNKDEVMEDGYYWGVEELTINKEGSLVVAGGSNSATSIIISEPDLITSEKQDSPLGTPKSIWDYYI